MKEEEFNLSAVLEELEKAIKNTVNEKQGDLRSKLLDGVKKILEDYQEEIEDTYLSQKYKNRLGIPQEEMVEIPKGMSPVDYYLQNKGKIINEN